LGKFQKLKMTETQRFSVGKLARFSGLSTNFADLSTIVVTGRKMMEKGKSDKNDNFLHALF
jgi:hypothetical protein